MIKFTDILIAGKIIGGEGGGGGELVPPTPGEELTATETVDGYLWQAVNKTTYASGGSAYASYDVTGHDYVFVSGAGGSNAVAYPLCAAYDSEGALLAKWGDDVRHPYTDYLVQLPEGAATLVINRGVPVSTSATLACKAAVGGGKGIVPVGSLSITENGTYDVSEKAQAVVAVEGVTPTGSLEITENGTYDVTDKASAVVAVPGSVPSGSVNIRRNGTFAVADYASASVLVSPITVQTTTPITEETFRQHVGTGNFSIANIAVSQSDYEYLQVGDSVKLVGPITGMTDASGSAAQYMLLGRITRHSANVINVEGYLYLASEPASGGGNVPAGYTKIENTYQVNAANLNNAAPGKTGFGIQVPLGTTGAVGDSLYITGTAYDSGSAVGTYAIWGAVTAVRDYSSYRRITLTVAGCRWEPTAAVTVSATVSGDTDIACFTASKVSVTYEGAAGSAAFVGLSDSFASIPQPDAVITVEDREGYITESVGMVILGGYYVDGSDYHFYLCICKEWTKTGDYTYSVTLGDVYERGY